MIKLNRLLMAAVIWTLLIGGSFSQTARGLTTIDVAVLSPSGEEIVDLDKDDFLLYEDDRRLEIRGFKIVSIPYRILIIDECTGDTGLARTHNYLTKDSYSMPFQRALISFLDVLPRHERLAVAQFGKTLEMLHGWSLPERFSDTIQLRSLKDSYGVDCRVNTDGAMEHSFLGKLSWIESKFEGVRGRKAVVWFGPPKNLGAFVVEPPPTLRARGERSWLPNIDDFPEFKSIRERLLRMQASFNFVLSAEEFSSSLQEFAEQKRRSYTALRHWAEATGGQLLLAHKVADVEDLARLLNREPGTRYSLSYYPLPQADGGLHRVKVQARDPQLRVLR